MTFDNNNSYDYGGGGFLLLDTTTDSVTGCDYGAGIKVIANSNGVEVYQGDGSGGFIIKDYNHIWMGGTHSVTITANTSDPYLAVSVDNSPLTANSSNGSSFLSGGFGGSPMLIQNGNWLVLGGGFVGSPWDGNCYPEQLDPELSTVTFNSLSFTAP